MSDINAPKKLLVVTDSNVKKLYADEVNDLLIKNGYDSKIYAFTAGEENKDMDTILGICGACIEHEMDRKSMDCCSLRRRGRRYGRICRGNIYARY